MEDGVIEVQLSALVTVTAPKNNAGTHVITDTVVTLVLTSVGLAVRLGDVAGASDTVAAGAGGYRIENLDALGTDLVDLLLTQNPRENADVVQVADEVSGGVRPSRQEEVLIRGRSSVRTWAADR